MATTPQEPDVNLASSLKALSESVARLERHMDSKLKEIEEDVNNQFAEVRETLKTLTGREAIHADAVLRNKVEIMWKVMVWAGGIVGTSLLGAVLMLVVKTQ